MVSANNGDDYLQRQSYESKSESAYQDFMQAVQSGVTYQEYLAIAQRFFPEITNEDTVDFEHFYAFYRFLMKKHFPHFEDAEFNKQDIEEIFKKLWLKERKPRDGQDPWLGGVGGKYRYKSPLKILYDFQKQVLMRMDNSDMEKKIQKISGNNSDVAQVTQDHYFYNLMKLYMHPILNLEKKTSGQVKGIDMQQALPVPQHDVVITSDDIALATGGVADCVAVYMHTKNAEKPLHALIHFDRYNSVLDLEPILETLKKETNSQDINVILVSYSLTTQIQQIYDYLLSKKVSNISAKILQTNKFYFQDPSNSVLKVNGQKESTLNINAAIHITVEKGKIRSFTPTMNTEASIEMLSSSLRQFSSSSYYEKFIHEYGNITYNPRFKNTLRNFHTLLYGNKVPISPTGMRYFYPKAIENHSSDGSILYTTPDYFPESNLQPVAQFIRPYDHTLQDLLDAHRQQINKNQQLNQPLIQPPVFQSAPKQTIKKLQKAAKRVALKPWK